MLKEIITKKVTTEDIKTSIKTIFQFIVKSRPLLFTIIAIILIAIFCLSLTPVSLQNDTFYTIKIGERIAKYGIDMQDHFSWHEGLSYTYPHWLYDLLTYFLYSQFNFEGIYVATCILSCILGLSIFFVSSKISKNQVISFFTTIGAIYLLKGYITARAQLVTFILFIFAIYCIEMFLQNKKKRYAIFLVLISLLIANLHCAVWLFLFILFLPYIAEYIVAVLADTIIYRKISIFFLTTQIKLLSKKKKNIDTNAKKIEKLQKILKEINEKNDHIKIKRDKNLKNPYKIKMQRNSAAKWLIVIMIVCILMGFLTPIGTTPFTYLYNTMQGNTTENINEHLPMTLTNQTEVVVTLIIFLSILIFTKVKIKLCDLFMLGGLTYLMLMSRRQLSMFAIICSIILAKLLVDLIQMYVDGGLEKINKTITSIISIIIISVCMANWSYSYARTRFNDSFVNEATYPVKACDYILENIDLGKAKFYNEYNYGSYMLFRNIPVFIDSRADLYAPEFSGLEDDIFMDFIETSNISKFYEDIFKKYNITHVITYKNSKTNMIITKTKDSNYKELYSDDHFVIYERLSASTVAEEQI